MRPAFASLFLVAVVVTTTACNEYDPEVASYTCSIDADCLSGYVCFGDSNGPKVCTSSDEISCANGYADCDEDPSGCEVFTADDELNCGACGVSCKSDETCLNGACAAICQAPASRCGDTCVNVTQSAQHCGTCDNACVASEVCVGGSCVNECPSGTKECAQSCVSVLNNPSHCGDCDQACATDEICEGGACKADCPTGSQLCGTSCVNVLTNFENCGACGQACPLGSLCDAGSCVMCGGGTTNCGNTCANLTIDRENCGTCGTVCLAAEVCDNGSCVCASTATNCSGVCADLQADSANCGGCGLSCEANEVCAAGSCRCATGFEDCDGNFANGCEADLVNDPTNCGACGTGCDFAVNAVPICQSGSCQVRCFPGWGDCSAAGGCESRLDRDSLNCGQCNAPCGSLEACYSGGVCETPNRFQRIYAGASHVCVIRDGDRLFCWGANNQGQVGSESATRIDTPFLVAVQANDVALGPGESLVIRGDSSQLIAFGSNRYEKLQTTDPALQVLPSPITTNGGHFVRAAIGTNHACVVTDGDGGVICWGLNLFGQLGTGSTNGAGIALALGEKLDNLNSVVDIGVGNHFTCALDANGAVYCWGENSEGQLGDGTTFNRLTPNRVPGLTAKALSVRGNTVCAISEAGELYCWGNSDFGTWFGEPDNRGVLSPLLIEGVDQLVGVGVASTGACVLDSAGQVFCLGAEVLSGGTQTKVPTHIPIIFGANPVFAQQLAVGNLFACVTDESRSRLFCWGDNGSAQLGQGGTTPASSTTPLRLTVTF